MKEELLRHHEIEHKRSCDSLESWQLAPDENDAKKHYIEVLTGICEFHLKACLFLEKL